MIERRVGCPQCRQEIRLTEAELADKRGFCALCDARFDLLADMVLVGGPMREQRVPRVSLALAPLPSDRVAVESVAPDAPIVLRPRRAPRQLRILLLSVAALVVWIASGLGTSGSVASGLFIACQVIAGASALRRVVWTRTLRERVSVEGGALRLERSVAGLRLETATVALDGVVELKVREPATPAGLDDHACTVTVASTTSPPVALGKRLGLDGADADWLRNALAARLRSTRG